MSERKVRRKKLLYFLPLIVGAAWLSVSLTSLAISASIGHVPAVVVSLILAAFGLFKLVTGIVQLGRPVSVANIHIEARTVLAALVLILLNALFSGRRAQVDMTESGKFTISPETLDVFRSADKPVHLTWYLSSTEKLPPKFRKLRRDTLDRLEQLSRAVGDKFRYEIIDPDDDDDLAGVLKRRGLAKTQYYEQSLEGQETRNVWSTMVLQCGAVPEKYIPNYDDYLGLEYQLAARALEFQRTVKPRVLIALPPAPPTVPGLKNRYKPRDYYSQLAARSLYGEFNVQGIDLDKPTGLPRKPDVDISKMIDGLRQAGVSIEWPMVGGKKLVTEYGCGEFDLDVLILVKPGKLEPRWEYEIERFLASGGTVIIFQSGVKLNFNEFSTDGPTIQPARLGFSELFSKLGITIGKGLLFGDRQFLMQTPQARLELACIQFVHSRDMDKRHPSTRRQPFLIVPFASPIRLDEAKLRQTPSLKYTVLFTTGNKTAVRDYSNPEVSTMLFDSKSYFDFYNRTAVPEESVGRKTLGLLVEGRFPWWLNGKKLPAWKQDPETGAGVPPLAVDDKQRGKGKLVLVSSGEFLNNDYFLKPYGLGVDVVQGQFLLKMVEAATASDRLAKVRSKQMDRRELKELAPEKFEDFAAQVRDPASGSQVTKYTDQLRSAGKGLVILVGEMDRDSLFKFYDKIEGGHKREMLQVGDRSWYRDALRLKYLEENSASLQPLEKKEYENLKGLKPPAWPICASEQLGGIIKDKYFYEKQVSEPFIVYVDETGNLVKKVMGPVDEANLDKLADRILSHRPESAAGGMDPVLAMQLKMVLPVPIAIAFLWCAWYVFRLLRRVRYNRKYGL